MREEVRLRADHVVTPRGAADDVVVRITAGGIVAVDPTTPAQGPAVQRVAGWLVPGFVDPHVHGGGGFDYATEDPEEAVQGRAFHAAHGTTTSLASLVSAPVDDLCRQLRTLAALVEDGVFAGIHLEGPFLSAGRRGAHDPNCLIPPYPETVDRLLVAGGAALSMITIAPELPGALAAVDRFVRAGVRVAVGHTDADLETVQAALDAGASVATHLFNAMPAIHHREPGPIPALLNDPRVAVELIADGFHLHPAILATAVRAAGAERSVLITDAMAAAGMPDGDFRLGGLAVAVRDGMARLVQPDGRPGSIAGSTLTMAAAFQVMTGVVGDVAVVAAMASTNAARYFGLADVGRIEPGARADLCVVDDKGTLRRVMQAGRWRDEAGSA